jgi:hypothetical protein
MANPNISLLGATYSGVSGVTLPKQGGGTATFPWVEGSQTVTENDTYNVTNLAQLIVNVSGGGSSPWTLIKSQENSVDTTSTQAATAVTISCGSAISTADKIVWVHIRDKAGARAGYFYGSDAFFVNYNRGSGSTSTFNVPAVVCLRYNNGAYAGTAGQYGVYGYSISSTGSLIVRRRYNSNYSLTINGTYKIYVYTLDLPSGLYLFD